MRESNHETLGRAMEDIIRSRVSQEVGERLAAEHARRDPTGNEVLGYYDPTEEETRCRRCAKGTWFGQSCLAIAPGEISWEDEIRCDRCGRRLADEDLEPGSFAALWGRRMRRRAERLNTRRRPAA